MMRPEPKTRNLGKYLRRALIVVVVGALGAVAGLLIRDLVGEGGLRGPVAVTTGTAAIGAPFSLTGHLGEPVSSADYAGKYLLIYFGYTFCPDVCPTELQDMGLAIDALGDDGARVQPIFITVDPERDTVEVLAEYAPAFHPRMLGLTGSVDEIAAVAKSFHVYYAKAKPAADDPPDEYFMDHSSLIFLMGPDGTYLAHFSFGTSVEALAAGIRKHL
jgi:protein SCO1/2